MKVTEGARRWRPAVTGTHSGPRARRALAVIAGLLAAGGMVAAAAPASAAPRSHSDTVTRAAGHASDPAAALARATMASTAVAPAAARRDVQLRAACPAVSPDQMRCFTLYRPQYAVNAALMRGAVTHPKGWGPKALERAYRLPVSRNSHQTIAVSIYGRTPKLARYLKIYREHYGLPPCGTASGCLRIVNQHGQTKPQAPSSLGSGWDIEATLDVSMISAACPHCKIIVVESNNLSDNSLGQTDNTAARLGAQVISNSYGQRENGQAMGFRHDYLHPGHMTVVSSGDSGFEAASFPASLAGVTAVGGTQMKRAHNARGFTERVWNDPGLSAAGSSGCSAYVGKPAWQHDGHCPGRTVADVSAIAADVPIFNAAWGGWITVAGTSAAAPFIAGVYGLAGNAAHLSPRHLYTHRGDFFDITRGNNTLTASPMASCGRDYLCVAKKGYDAPTGVGTPDGTSGF